MVENWYVPCNIKFCNVMDIIDTKGEIIWRRGASIKKGDIAYIYIGAPLGQIKYRCEVVEEAVSSEELRENLYAKREDDKPKQQYMKLKMLKKYDDGELPLQLLKNNGLTQVQRQARNSRELQAFLNKYDREENDGRD